MLFLVSTTKSGNDFRQNDQFVATHRFTCLLLSIVNHRRKSCHSLWKLDDLVSFYAMNGIVEVIY